MFGGISSTLSFHGVRLLEAIFSTHSISFGKPMDEGGGVDRGGGGKSAFLCCFGLIFLRSALRAHILVDPTPQECQYHPKKAMGDHISVTFSNLENDPLKPKWPLPLPPYQPLFRRPDDHLTPLPKRKKDLFWGPRDKGKTKTSCGIFRRGAEPCLSHTSFERRKWG